MARFIVSRVAALVGVMLALTFVVFILQKISSVDPVREELGATASSAALAAERRRIGYDQPVAEQYVHYVGHLFQGNLGDSLRTRQPVAHDLRSFIPASLELVIAALVLAAIIGVLLGIATGVRARGAALARIPIIGGAAVPGFMLAMLSVVLFYHDLHWFPATGRSSYGDFHGPTGFLVPDGLITGHPQVTTDALWHLAMPALCLALAPAAAIARVLRGGIMTALRSDQVRTARAKGMREGAIVVKHTLRNAAGPALSMAGVQVGLLLASLVVVEQIFAWPGIGLYLAQSIPASDFPAIIGVTLGMGLTYVVVNTLVDILQAKADPRITI